MAHLQEVVWGSVEWFDLVQEGQVAGSCPPCSIKCRNFLTSREPGSFSRSDLLHGVSKCMILVLSNFLNK